MNEIQSDLAQLLISEASSVATSTAPGHGTPGPSSSGDDDLFIEGTVRRIELVYLQRKLLSRLQFASPGELYKPLDPERRQIRLLTLAAARKRSDPLRGELVTVSLDENPNFDALSYAWSTSGAVLTIELCAAGCVASLPVYRNLDGVLRALRRRYGPVTIYVDAP